jgi:hypothetical protein
MICMVLTPIHVCRSYAFYGQYSYVATFRANPIELDEYYCSQEKGPRHNPQHADWLIYGSPTHFLSSHSHWSNRWKSIICWQISYISLLDQYLQHVISIFNTCSWGLTHRSLTDTVRGKNLGGASFSHHSLRPSQPMIIHFSLMTLSSLNLTS